MSKKIISIVATLTLIGGVAMTATPAFGLTAAELQTQINTLMAQLQTLQSQLATIQSTTTTTTFTVNLAQGTRSNDVKAVQEFLISKGKLASGLNTGYFGSLTLAAVKAYQTSKAITPVSGYWGPLTRAAANAEGGVVVTPTTSPSPTTSPTPVAGTGLTVALASDTPVAAVVASGTAFNSGIKVNLTAGTDGQVKVTGVTVKKSGISPNTYYSGIDIIDSAGVRHGNVASSLTADNTATFTFASSPITIAAGQTNSITVRFNITAGTVSGTSQFAVTAVTTDGAAVSGTFPISGNTMTLTTGTSNIATIVVNEQAINASGASLNVNPTAVQEIAKFSVQESSSTENIQVQKLTIYNIGTAADSDYKDVELVAQDGTILATAQSSDKYVTFDLTNSPYTITKGLTKNFTIRAKIVNGTSRTIQFEVYNDYDLQAKGVSSAALILPTTTTGGTAGTGTSFPVGNKTSYNLVTIGSGTLSFNKSSDSPSSAVSVGDQNVTLAKYDIKANGEDMEIRQLKMYIKVTSTTLDLSGTVFVNFNDTTIWSGAYSTTSLLGTGALADGLLVALSLSSYPLMTAGQNNTIKVIGTIGTSAVALDTIQVRTDVTSVKRMVTNDISDLAVNSSDGNQITVKGLALTVRTLSTPVATSVVSGTSAFELARIDLDASSSGEDVKVSTLKIADTKAGTNAAYTDIANLVLYDSLAPSVALQTSTTTSVNAVSNTFTFTTPILVSKSTVKHLILKGDIVARTADTAATETQTFNVANAAANVTATGATTGNSVSSPTISGDGQAMTVVSAGTLTLSLVSGTGKSPSSAQNVVVGTQGNVFFAFKLTSQYEAQKITTLTLTASANGAGALSIKDLTNIGLYADSSGAPAATPFATASQFSACVVNVCTYTWTATDNLLPAAVQPGSTATIYVKASVSGEGTSIVGDNFVMKFTTPDGDLVSKGAYTGTAASSISGTAVVSGVTYITPFNVSIEGVYPSSGSSTTTTIGANSTLARFKLTNNGSGQITLTTAKFYDAGTHTGTSARYTLYASSEGSSDYTNTTLEASGADESSGVLDYSTLTTTTTLNGGAYRYLTLSLTTATSVASGDAFTFSVASLGDLKYSVTEANLGYDADGDGALSSTISSLPISGTPTVGTLTKQ